MDFAVEYVAREMLSGAAPLLKEKWNSSGRALVAKAHDPLPLNGASTRAAFPSDNHPIDARKFELSRVGQPMTTL